LIKVLPPDFTLILPSDALNDLKLYLGSNVNSFSDIDFFGASSIYISISFATISNNFFYSSSFYSNSYFNLLSFYYSELLSLVTDLIGASSIYISISFATISNNFFYSSSFYSINF